MAIRYVSRPRRRSGSLLSVVPVFAALGSGTASNPVFSGSLVSDLPAFTIVGSGSFESVGGNTFTPTHYVDAGASGSGDGSNGSPFTLTQACALAQPGWRVLLRAGTYVGPLRGGGLGTAFTASFRIATDGTQANPIIFFAENYAALTPTGRTILQHTGTVQGYGCPVLSLGTGHHFYGLYISEEQAPTAPDTGPVVIGGKYNRISYCRFNRGPVTWPLFNGESENNHAALRFEGLGCQFNLVSDCYFEGYSREDSFGNESGIHLFTAGGGNTEALSTGLLTVENCLFYGCENAVTSKGAGPTRPIMGGNVFRRNLILGSTATEAIAVGAVNFMDNSGELGRNQVYQNVMVGGHHLVQCYNQAGWAIRDIDVINNTLINPSIQSEKEGLICTNPDTTAGSGWRVHNNIKVGPTYVCIYRYDGDQAMLSRSHNFGSGHASNRWAYADNRGNSVLTLAQWVAATGFDDNSSEANPLLVSTTWGNADLGKLQAGSPCRGSGLDFLNLNGAGTSAPCHIGAYSSDDVIIGIRPLA